MAEDLNTIVTDTVDVDKDCNLVGDEQEGDKITTPQEIKDAIDSNTNGELN